MMIRTSVTILFMALISSASGWTTRPIPPADKTSSSNLVKQLSSSVGGAALIAACVVGTPAHAASSSNVAHGQQLFQADCAQCHMAIKALPGDQTSLQKEALEKYRGGVDQAKVKSFVQDELPHSFMPFALKYNKQDYSDVAKYVVDQAKNGKW